MVLVEDECRVEKESGTTRIWYPRGEYPIIRVNQEKDAWSFYGALNIKSGQCHVRDFPWQNSVNTVSFLRGLERIYQGKKVLLIWDGAPWHRGEVKKYLKEKPKKWQLHIIYFPAYSPDLNPQEKVWKDSREHTTHNSEQNFQDKLYAFRQYITGKRFKTNFLDKYA